MDGRTAQLVEALDPLTVELLVELLVAPRVESELVAALAWPQATVHRKVRSLAVAGVIRQVERHGRGGSWSVAAHRETEQVVKALLDLADALAESDQRERDEVRNRTADGRLRKIDGGASA